MFPCLTNKKAPAWGRGEFTVGAQGVSILPAVTDHAFVAIRADAESALAAAPTAATTGFSVSHDPGFLISTSGKYLESASLSMHLRA